VEGKAPPGGVLKHAPDLAKVGERLRPRWLYEWQSDPAAIYPGTTMTQFDFRPLFPNEAAPQKEGVKVAVELLLNFEKFNVNGSEPKK
jgi:cbb3-type cytochrome oxidase cytochrome c subunit